jgi:predicted glycosyltransferase
VGIGHLVRTARLAEASLANGQVLLICGGKLPPRLRMDARIRVVSLPPLQMNADNKLVDAIGNRKVCDIFVERIHLAEQTVRQFAADAVIVEMFPFGRKKFASEIFSIIRAARERKSTVIVSSVRDVLVSRGANQEQYDERAATWLNEHFDAVLIHSDPNFIALKDTFSSFDEIAIPTYYTGYISSGSTPRNAAREPRIIVSAGGGRVGHRLLEVAAESYDRMQRELNLDMTLVTGPNGAKARVKIPGRNGPTTVEFIEDLPGTFARSAISVSQCGYNTAVDVLQTRTPAIFVPFGTASEDEELRRAELLSRRNCAVLLRQKTLTADALLVAAAKAISTQKSATTNIDLAGAGRSSELIRDMCGHA